MSKVKKTFLLVIIAANLVLFTGCRNSHSRHNSITIKNNTSLRIEVDLLDSDKEPIETGDLTIKRQWTSPNTWHPKPQSKHISLRVWSFYEGSNSRVSTAMLSGSFDENIIWPQTNQPAEPIEVFFESSLGKINFQGQIGTIGNRRRTKVKSFGTVIVEPYKAGFDTLWNAFADKPSLKSVMRLIIKQIDIDKIVEYSDLGMKFTIDQAAELAGTDYSAAETRKLIDSGYKFDAEDILKLARYRISFDYINGWKEHGYKLSAADFVYASQRNLSAKMAAQWKDAGYDVDLQQVYWIKQRNLKPDIAVKWRQAEYELNLEKLYWIKQRNLGYGQASKWKQAGYDFSLDDLYKLKQYNIDSIYGAVLAEPGYELLTVDEMIKFKNSGISKETIIKLRNRK